MSIRTARPLASLVVPRMAVGVRNAFGMPEHGGDGPAKPRSNRAKGQTQGPELPHRLDFLLRATVVVDVESVEHGRLPLGRFFKQPVWGMLHRLHPRQKLLEILPTRPIECIILIE